MQVRDDRMTFLKWNKEVKEAKPCQPRIKHPKKLFFKNEVETHTFAHTYTHTHTHTSLYELWTEWFYKKR
jgi:hypothetical protein